MLKRRNRTVGRMLALCISLTMLVTPAWTRADSAVSNRTADNNIAKLAAFSDIKGSYAENAIERLASFQLISGVQGDRFVPQKTISRQDFSVLLAKAAGLLPKHPEDAPFSDVAAASPYAPYLTVLAETDIMRGRSDGSLGVKEELTRQDLAVLLERLINKSGITAENQQTATFSDEHQIAAYAKDAVNTVSSTRWMIGHNGKFNPLGKVTRADAAVIAERIFTARSTVAQQVDFSVNTSKLSLLAGTTQRIEVKAASNSELPFTPVFSFDRPELGTILADGTFIAGPTKGTGQITITVGYKTVVVPVEITDGKTEKNESTEKPADETQTVQQSGNNPEQLTNFAPDSFFGVKTTGPADSYFHELEMKYPGPVGGLVTPSETWTGYARQFGREVTVALPETKSLHKVMLNFRQDKKQGITLPEYMELEVSRDGKAWYYAGKATHAVSPSDETPLVRTLAISLPSVEAQYVRVRFPVKIFTFARQLQVLGSDVNEAAPPVLLAPVRKGTSMDDRKAGDRIENMLLAYSGAYADRGSWQKADFLPLVGYMAPDGKVLDRMFDSILFLPYPNLPSTKGGWEYYLNDLFRPGRQLDALNDAMMEYNKRRGTLHNSPVTENVVLSLPYPDPNQRDFGQVLKDQDSLSFQSSNVGEERAFNYRKQALEWYFTQLKKRWDNAEYRYLKLDGIYWYHELVDDAVPRERELIWDTATLVHNQALRFYWIPYFGATGLSEWRQLGFDYAFVQPNFYSDKPIPVDRIEATLAVANKYGMGIEVEGDERMVRDLRFYQTYYNQLIAAHKLGIDKDKIHAYYYGSKSLLEAVNSKDPNGRAVYDDTYLWMRGRFTKQDYLLPPVTQQPEK